MFVSYLIDPFTGVVESVYDGFERAPRLLGTDRIDVTPLWSATWGSGTTAGGAMLAVDAGRVFVSTPGSPDSVSVSLSW